jgi:hypothetical protein
VGDQARRDVVAVFFFTAVFFLQLYEYAVSSSFRKLYSIFFNLASPTSQRITLICVIVKFWNNIGGNVVRENCV